MMVQSWCLHARCLNESVCPICCKGPAMNLPDPLFVGARHRTGNRRRPLTAHWNPSLAAHVLYLALNLKCMADSRQLPASEAAKGLVHFLHHRMNQAITPPTCILPTSCAPG